MVILRQEIEADVEIKAPTRARYLQDVNYCVKTWPELEKLRPDEVTEEAIRAWKGRAMTEGTGFRPPGSKTTTATKGRSGRCFNGGLSALRRLLNIAVRHGAIHENVIMTASKKLRAKDDPKKPYAPSPEVMQAIVTEIEARSGIGGWSVEVADFCRGLAYTGCRVAEASELLWSDVDFTAGKLRIRGTKTQSSDRTLPLNTALRELLDRILKRRKEHATEKRDGEPYVNPIERIFRVSEAQNSLDRACKKLNTQRITHHNLRDYFCTRSLMSGVPIRVLAEWLGHADNGALLLKRYSHIMPEDSSAQAAKVVLK
jgi:integrase